MRQFETEAIYLGQPIVVKCDDLKELHVLLAGIADLNFAYKLMRYKIEQAGDDPDTVVPDVRTHGEATYYGVKQASTKHRRNLSFGEYKDPNGTVVMPFFSKGLESYYDHSLNEDGGSNVNHQAYDPNHKPQGQTPDPQARPDPQHPHTGEPIAGAKAAYHSDDGLPF